MLLHDDFLAILRRYMSLNIDNVKFYTVSFSMVLSSVIIIIMDNSGSWDLSMDGHAFKK